MKYEHDLGLRVVAYIIDSIIVGIFSNFFSRVTHIGVAVFDGLNIASISNFWDEAVWFALYFVGFAVFNKGITIGKMATNQQVLTTEMVDVSTTNLIVRELIKVVLMPILFINFLIVLFRDDNRSIHDLLTDTVVLQEVKVQPTKLEQQTKKERTDDFYE